MTAILKLPVAQLYTLLDFRVTRTSEEKYSSLSSHSISPSSRYTKSGSSSPADLFLTWKTLRVWTDMPLWEDYGSEKITVAFLLISWWNISPGSSWQVFYAIHFFRLSQNAVFFSVAYLPLHLLTLIISNKFLCIIYIYIYMNVSHHNQDE